MAAIFTNIAEIFAKSGWAQIFFTEGGWKYAVMLAVACVLLYLAIVKQFEPLLLLPIGFGMLMTNLPLDGIFHMDIFINETNHINWELLGSSGGMVDYIYLGVKLGIYPPLMSPPSWPRTCWAPSRLPRTATWRWCRSSSRPS